MWHREALSPVDGDGPIDPSYNEVRSEHAAIDPADYPFLDPSIGLDGVPDPNVRALIDDPGALFGHDLLDPSHPALGADGYGSRYTTESPSGRAWDVYPGDGGAAPGTRVVYTDAHAFAAQYPFGFDRIGPSTGKYLSVQGFSFEQRALPLSALKGDYHQFSFDPDGLPPGAQIEVSRAAPGFGQPGGAVQVRVILDGKALQVSDIPDAFIE